MTLWGNMFLLLSFSFLAGVVTALSPCILPVLPAILASGVAQGRLRPLGTILGLICSFCFFTLTLTAIVQVTGLSSSVLRFVAIALIFFFGIVMIFPKLSDWFARLTAPIAGWGQMVQGKKARTGFWGGFLFGVALGLLWTPCAGPILAAITTLVASHAINGTAVLMTVVYGIGAGIPLFCFAYGSAQLLQKSRLLARHAERIRQFFGIVMVVFAVLLCFNWDMLITERLSRLVPAPFSEKSLPTTGALATEGPAPELQGIVRWINSPPLTLAELKGKVVLIDFWTYSCMNCLRTLPFLEKWYRDYSSKGLVIIGVHTPEFEFEKNYANVERATRDLGVKYPVALDNNYATWNAYHNQYWPAHYLIDKQGIIRQVHFGEGGYHRDRKCDSAAFGALEVEAKEPESSSRPISPETYLGSSRAQHYPMKIVPGQTVDYQYEAPLQEDAVGLKGLWCVEPEFIVAEGDESSLESNFLATHVYLVLAGSSKTPLEIVLDGQPYGQISVDGDRKYDIVTTSYGRHRLSLKVPKGIQAYAFTFGAE